MNLVAPPQFSQATSPGYFTEGDELKLTGTSGVVRGWISEINANNDIKVVDFSGMPIVGSYSAKVIRSGRRNLQAQTMANVTTLANPLNTFSANLFEQVIQASAIEYTDGWKAYCNCYGEEENLIASTNPYILGTKGVFRPKTSYLHLTQRTQDNYDGNTNIREDGIMTSYAPFYQLDPTKKWEIDKKDWTYTSEVTEFNPFGEELENRDALGRYSAATFGFNQTMATAVAANAQYKQIGFDSFEDYGFSPCADNHFKFNPDLIDIDDEEAHSGYRSIKVPAGSSVTLEKQIKECIPQGECPIQMVVNEDDKYLHLSPDLGVPGYVFDYTIISGNPDNLGYNPINDTFSFEKAGIFQIQVSFTDAEGCTVLKTITSINGNVTIQ